MTTIQLEKPRIIVLDCNRFELATLADSLRLQGLDVVGQAADEESALQLFQAITPNALVINLQGCNHDCIDLLQNLRKSNSDLGIVILTDSPDLRLYGFRQSELPQGSQLIEKSALSNLREIKTAVEISMKPGVHTGWLANAWDSSLNSLTDIQIETLRLLALGLSNSDIGKATNGAWHRWPWLSPRHR